MREADLPAEQPEAPQEARIPAADAHPRGSRGVEVASPAGPQAALGLIWHVRGHAAFRDLARSPVRRHGALWARSAVAEPDTPPRVAYAISRAVGDAVQRNRVRRRLRALVRLLAPELARGTAHLVGVGPGVVKRSPVELERDLRAVLGLSLGDR